MGKLRDDYKALVERVREHDEELADEFEVFSESSLMEAAEDAALYFEQLEEAQHEVARVKGQMEREQKRTAAFQAYGVDFEALRPAERRLVEGYEGDLSREAIAEFVAAYDLPVK